MLISIGYMCLMLCAPLDWQYAELPSSANDAVLCSVLVGCGTSKQIKKNKKKQQQFLFCRWRIPKAPPTVPPSTDDRPTVHRPKKYFADQISLISENWTSVVRTQLKLGKMDLIDVICRAWSFLKIFFRKINFNR